MDLNALFGKAKVEEKKLIEFIKPVDPTIKSKLQGMASSGFSGTQPRLITMELIAEAIAEYKQEKQIFSLEIRISFEFQETFTNIKFRKFNKCPYFKTR